MEAQANKQPSQVVVTKQTKSVGIALILTFLFGSIGMFYSTIKGALIMLAIETAIIVLTMGFGFFLIFLTNPICMIWGGLAAKNYNEQLLRGEV